MQNYQTLKESDEIVYSPIVQTNGVKFRLKIYPNGNGNAKNQYISVFIEMTSGFKQSKYEYKIEMINFINP